jgi:hypothetical protein
MIIKDFFLPIVFQHHLLQFLKEVVIPMYDDFLRNQLRIINLDNDQRSAISFYCKTIMNRPISIGEELDVNEIHPVFDHMRKNILLF